MYGKIDRWIAAKKANERACLAQFSDERIGASFNALGHVSSPKVRKNLAIDDFLAELIRKRRLQANPMAI